MSKRILTVYDVEDENKKDFKKMLNSLRVKTCVGCKFLYDVRCTVHDEYDDSIEYYSNAPVSMFVGEFNTAKNMREDEDKCGRKRRFFKPTFLQKILDLIT